MRKALTSILTAGALTGIALYECGCETPGAGATAGSVGADWAAGKSLANGAPAGVFWAWKGVGALLGGQGDYDREKAAAEEGARMQIEAQERMQREAEARERARIEAARPRVVFNEITMDHNIELRGVKGMKVHMNMDANNLNGVNLQPTVYFFDSNGNKLMDKDGKCRTNDGQVSFAGPVLVPSYDKAGFRDSWVFIDYRQFDITELGKHDLRFKIQVHDKDAKRLVGQSQFYGMAYTVRSSQ